MTFDKIKVGLGFRGPLVIRASEPRLMSKFPGVDDELWEVDIKTWRSGEGILLFEKVFFVEMMNADEPPKKIAVLYGIEHEDGCPTGFDKDLARGQQLFIEYLRNETRGDNARLGLVAKIFNGHEYSAEGKATAAYIVAKKQPLLIRKRGKPRPSGRGRIAQCNEVAFTGMGCQMGGKYETFCVDPIDDGWIMDAESLTSYEELGAIDADDEDENEGGDEGKEAQK